MLLYVAFLIFSLLKITLNENYTGFSPVFIFGFFFFIYLFWERKGFRYIFQVAPSFSIIQLILCAFKTEILCSLI